MSIDVILTKNQKRMKACLVVFRCKIFFFKFHNFTSHSSAAEKNGA